MRLLSASQHVFDFCRALRHMEYNSFGGCGALDCERVGISFVRLTHLYICWTEWFLFPLALWGFENTDAGLAPRCWWRVLMFSLLYSNWTPVVVELRAAAV